MFTFLSVQNASSDSSSVVINKGVNYVLWDYILKSIAYIAYLFIFYILSLGNSVDIELTGDELLSVERGTRF
jgi:hypothetical protein